MWNDWVILYHDLRHRFGLSPRFDLNVPPPWKQPTRLTEARALTTDAQKQAHCNALRQGLRECALQILNNPDHWHWYSAGVKSNTLNLLNEGVQCDEFERERTEFVEFLKSSKKMTIRNPVVEVVPSYNIVAVWLNN